MKKRFYIIISMVIIFILISFNVFGIKGDLYVLFRNIPKKKVLQNVEDYSELKTENFIIKHKTNDLEVLKLVEKAAEKHYGEICNQYDYYPKDKAIVVLYENPDDLLRNANLGKSKPPMGVYYASTIQILSPRLWVPAHEDMEYLFMNEGPMVHEFTHLIIDDITKGNYPLWFTEGLALYSEYIYTGYEWGKDVKWENLYSIDELNSNFNKLDQHLAYTQSFRVVRYMVEAYGFEKVKEILEKLEEGYVFRNAFEMVTKDKFSKLDIKPIDKADDKGYDNK
ncbi:peptidase MA family metallohydrolase [Maledivibacter halophilus]|uniref:Peptidase MA superfamily protein n=1 Tax=Maledivibacter halophilus TaxID=36842 RepID=A0A1T5MJK0_9FIRM|nr:peptidase MA family metallohydrolase [Maledivibacter halophilus]SKC88401.1 Peptidase MA superfamily protein [Maledivibacter halophilus]